MFLALALGAEGVLPLRLARALSVSCSGGMRTGPTVRGVLLPLHLVGPSKLCRVANTSLVRRRTWLGKTLRGECSWPAYIGSAWFNWSVLGSYRACLT